MEAIVRGIIPKQFSKKIITLLGWSDYLEHLLEEPWLDICEVQWWGPKCISYIVWRFIQVALPMN